MFSKPPVCNCKQSKTGGVGGLWMRVGTIGSGQTQGLAGHDSCKAKLNAQNNIGIQNHAPDMSSTWFYTMSWYMGIVSHLKLSSGHWIRTQRKTRYGAEKNVRGSVSLNKERYHQLDGIEAHHHVLAPIYQYEKNWVESGSYIESQW